MLKLSLIVIALALSYSRALSQNDDQNVPDSILFHRFIALYDTAGKSISNSLVLKYFQVPHDFPYQFTTIEILRVTKNFIVVITQLPHIAGYDTKYLNTYARNGTRIDQIEIAAYAGDLSGFTLKESCFCRRDSGFDLIEFRFDGTTKNFQHTSKKSEFTTGPIVTSYRITDTGLILPAKKGCNRSRKKLIKFIGKLLEDYGYPYQDAN